MTTFPLKDRNTYACPGCGSAPIFKHEHSSKIVTVECPMCFRIEKLYGSNMKDATIAWNAAVMWDRGIIPECPDCQKKPDIRHGLAPGGKPQCRIECSSGCPGRFTPSCNLPSDALAAWEANVKLPSIIDEWAKKTIEAKRYWDSTIEKTVIEDLREELAHARKLLSTRTNELEDARNAIQGLTTSLAQFKESNTTLRDEIQALTLQLELATITERGTW